MARSARLKLLLAVSMLLPTTALAPVSAQEREAFDEISADMEEIRNLDLLEPLDIRFITRDELREELEGDLVDQEDAAAIADNQRVLVAFGFLEPEENPQELYVALLGEQVAGYYDPETNEMVVVLSGDGEEMTAVEEVTFAHETVHALQDQHFDLASFNDVRMEGTDDESLAVTALIEGDASLAEIDYLLADMSLARDYLDEVNEASEVMDVVNSAPAFLVQTLTFPYNQGFEFAQHLYDEGGWDLVDDAYDNPPNTTEQVLHPQKYLDGEQAVPIAVPGVAGALGDEWRTLEENSMGEFVVSILLSGSDLGEDQVEAAHTGWGGDAYVALTDDEDTAIAWVSEWDSEDDAEEFSRALVARDAERLDADVEEEDGVITITSGETVVQVVQDGTRVSYLQGPDVATVHAMAETLDGQD
jgi:hypothetical protein